MSDPASDHGPDLEPSDLPGDEPAGEAALVSTVERLRAEVDGLRLAMRSRAVIEQAKGMLMERHGCTPDEAFERLARLSQHANVKLADVAAALVDVTLDEARAGRADRAGAGSGRSAAGAVASRTAASGTGVSGTVGPGTAASGTAASGTAGPGTAASGTAVSETAASGTAVSGTAGSGTDDGSGASAAADGSRAGRPLDRPLDRQGTGPRRRSAAAQAAGRPTPADVARTAREQLATRWPKQVSGDGEFGTRLRAQGRRTRVRAELMAARAPDDVLGTVVGTALGEHPPQAAVLAAVDVNGLITAVSTHGIPGPVAARWRHLPVDLRLPVSDTARTGRTLWLSSSPEPGAEATDAAESGRADAPLGLGLPDDWTTAAVLPLLHDGACHGVLGMTWTGDPLPDTVRAEIERVAAGAAAVLRRFTPQPEHTAPGDPEGADPTIAVLDVLLHPVVLCDPVLAEDDRMLDLQVRHANQAAESAAGTGRLAGRSFLELWPDSVRSGLFAACREVRRTGRPADLRDHPWRFSSGGRMHTGLADIRVTRYRDGVLITWGRVRPGGNEPGGREARP